MLACAMTTFAVSFGSAVMSTALTVHAAQFKVDLEVALLGLTLYVLGFMFGQ